ncbi:MAG: hypothetical protein DRJ03_01950 [Chloroflexi bacterium]|nr:MAG: hypothetical protein DRJ03_01950 [Chloroflexota bacterium]
MAEHNQQIFSKKVISAAGLLERAGLPTYAQFVQGWLPSEITVAIAEKVGGVETPIFVAAMQAFYSALIVAKSGDTVFTLSAELIHALRDTEIPDIPVEEVRLPFDGINVDFPRGTLGGPAAEVGRLLMCMVPGDRFRVVYHHDAFTNYVSFLPEEGKTLFQCAASAQEQQHQMLSDPSLVQAFRDAALYADYWKTDMFRLAINTMLYITSPDADVVEDKTQLHEIHAKLQGLKKGRKQEVLLDKLRKAKQRKRYIVGAKFRLAAEYNAALTDKGKKWALQQRVRVMGHWKNQPYGPKSELRRRQWLAPYWKGPSYAEMVEKGYVVR